MKVFKNSIFTFVLGLIIAGAIGVIAISVSADDISYGSGTVKDAIDDLYTEKSIFNKLTELSLETATLTNNTKDTIYAALFSYTSLSNASSVVSTRTSIASITGAESTEVFYSFNSSTKYGIRIYKLTNCASTVSVTTGNNGGTANAGMILLFY